MERREFMTKTGVGLAGIMASGTGLVSAVEATVAGHGQEKAQRVIEGHQGLDFSVVREDFPPLARMRAYLDTAFVGLMPRQVKAAHDKFLEERLQFGPMGTDQSILGVWLGKTEQVRVKVAQFLGAQTNELAFTMCTGCGSNIALNGINWHRGDNAIIDDLEYPTDFHVLNAIKKKGVEIRIARHKNGMVSPETFAALADTRTRAIVVTHVSYLNGFRHDLKKLADIIHSFGGYLVVDSAQSIGGIKVDVKAEDVDFMSGIPYKWLNGPNGVGFLYVRENLIEKFEPDRLGWASTNDFVSLETMESRPLPNHAKRFEYGTLAFESVYALDAALDYINNLGIEAIERQNLKLVDLLRDKLQSIGVKFITPEGNRSPILSFYQENERALGRQLKEQQIYITARRWGRGQVRISPHFYNNEEDIEAFVNAYTKARRI